LRYANLEEVLELAS